VNLPERRKAERFTGKIPIVFGLGEGLTCDFSTDGVYFDTDQNLQVGEQLHFDMYLNHLEPANPLRISFWGKVLRTKPGPEKTGIAVAILGHRFEGQRECAERHSTNISCD
jgi:hypothetical protein